MKRNDFLSALVDGLLTCLLAIAGAGCLATAFSLPVDMTEVVRTAAIFAVFAIVCARLRWGWLLLLLGMLFGGQLLYSLDIENDFYAALNRILTMYNQGYGWGVPEYILEYEAQDLTLLFQTLAACSALLVGITLSKCLHSPAALVALLPVFPCMVITDTVPSESYLLLLILPLAMLALTHYSRRADARQANRLTIMLLIPLVLAGTLLFNHTPQSEYQEPDDDEGLFAIVKDLAEYFPFLQGNSPDIGISYPLASDKVSLGTMDDRTSNYNKVLEVVASQSGALYLRGRSYMGYTGLNWEAWPENAVMKPPGDNYRIENNQTIQIHALQTQFVQYFPYYPNGGANLVDGALDTEVQDTYLYSYRPLRGDWENIWLKQYAALGINNSTYAAMLQYTQLPESTAREALRHLALAGVDGSENIIRTAQRIGNYVENSAKYSLAVRRMPTGQEDFAIWFLDEGDTGYCVHFATAATVLLRAAGIPARYVEGYMVDAQAGQVVTVRGMHAHAWVEYYVPHVGWVILEATPSDGLPVPPTTEPTEPTQPTEPTEPTQPTEPTGPTGPTQPTEPTGPTEPTRPTFPTEPTGPTEPTAPTGPTEPTAPTTPTEPTQPAGSTPPAATEPVGTTRQPMDLSWLWVLLGWIGMAMAVVAALIGQWRLRLALRRKAMAGHDFKQVRKRWRYACMLARLCHHGEPKVLLELLKKAKFGPNGLDERELRQFDRYHAACIRCLSRFPWYKRLVLRLILAAW